MFKYFTFVLKPLTQYIRGQLMPQTPTSKSYATVERPTNGWWMVVENNGRRGSSDSNSDAWSGQQSACFVVCVTTLWAPCENHQFDEHTTKHGKKKCMWKYWLTNVAWEGERCQCGVQSNNNKKTGEIERLNRWCYFRSLPLSYNIGEEDGKWRLGWPLNLIFMRGLANVSTKATTLADTFQP